MASLYFSVMLAVGGFLPIDSGDMQWVGGGLFHWDKSRHSEESED